MLEGMKWPITIVFLENSANVNSVYDNQILR